MKFTEEQAREALRAELTNKGRKSLAMSDRTLAKTTESLIKRLADEEMGLPDFVEIAVEILNPVNDNIRKDKSDFANKWKEEHPEDKQETNPNDPPKPGESEELKKLREEFETYKAASEKEKAEALKSQTIAQKRKDVTAKLKEKGVSDDEWLNDFLSEVNIDENFDVDAKAESWVKLYNRQKAKGGGSLPPVPPKDGGKDFSESLDDVLALAKQRNEQLGFK